MDDLMTMLMNGDGLHQAAARRIRRLQEELASVEMERDEAELARRAHAFEISRMNDHRQAFAAKQALKAARR